MPSSVERIEQLFFNNNYPGDAICGCAKMFFNRKQITVNNENHFK